MADFGASSEFDPFPNGQCDGYVSVARHRPSSVDGADAFCLFANTAGIGHEVLCMCGLKQNFDIILGMPRTPPVDYEGGTFVSNF